MLTEEFNTLRTELLITQQQNTCFNCDICSVRRSLRLSKRIVAVTGRQLRNANIKIDYLNWQLEGTYTPLPQCFNPITNDDIIINTVEINILNIRCALDSQIARSQVYSHLHQFHGFPSTSIVNRYKDPVYSSGEQESTELFLEYHHFLDRVAIISLEPSDHLSEYCLFDSSPFDHSQYL